MENDIKILQEKRNVPESAFKLHYPDIYNRVKEAAKALSVTRWNEAKYIYTKQLKELPRCKICGKPVEFRSMKRGYKSTCSRECDLALKSRTQKENKDAKSKMESLGSAK